MKPPIVADNRGDVLVFASVGDAELYMEPIDVLDNEYEVFDSEGFLLEIQVVLKGRRERVVLSRPGAPATAQVERLRKLLLDLLPRISIPLPDDVEDVTLIHLIDLVADVTLIPPTDFLPLPRHHLSQQAGNWLRKVGGIIRRMIGM